MTPPARSLSQTPAGTWLNWRRGLGRPSLLFAGMVCGMQLGRGETWALFTFVPLVIVLIAVDLWFAIAPPGTRRMTRLLRGVRAKAPWFEPGVVTWVPAERSDALLAAVREHDVVVHELDGRSIGSLDELLAALGGRFGARTTPADPVERVLAIVGGVVAKSRQLHVVVWHDAERFARHDPAACHRLLSAWWCDPSVSDRTLLCLLAAPPTPLPVPEGERAIAAAGPARPAPDVAGLADAPGGAWWKPNAGKLA